MSIWSPTYQQSVFKRYHSGKHFSEFLLTRWRQKSSGTDMEQNYVTVILSSRTSKNPDKMKILTPFFGVILEMFPDGCARRTQRFSWGINPVSAQQVSAVADGPARRAASITASCCRRRRMTSVIYRPSTVASIVNFVRPTSATTVQFITLSV